MSMLHELISEINSKVEGLIDEEFREVTPKEIGNKMVQHCQFFDV